MTEAEAKTKWCPMMPRGYRANRASDGFVRDDLSCIGSECMAWRWKQEGIEHGEPIYNDTYGHCGLASK